MGNKKTKAMIELIDKIERVLDDTKCSQLSRLLRVHLAVLRFRAEFYGPKQQAAKAKKAAKRRARRGGCAL